MEHGFRYLPKKCLARVRHFLLFLFKCLNRNNLFSFSKNSRFHTMPVKRKQFEEANKIALAIVIVDRIIVRIRALKLPEDSHLLPGLTRELELAKRRQ